MTMSRGRKQHRAKLRHKRRELKRERHTSEKDGACNRYTYPKASYHCLSVAMYDRDIMAAKYPDHTFQVFKCGCGAWHIGRPKEEQTE